jgi:hypothetical protein
MAAGHMNAICELARDLAKHYRPLQFDAGPVIAWLRDEAPLTESIEYVLCSEAASAGSWTHETDDLATVLVEQKLFRHVFARPVFYKPGMTGNLAARLLIGASSTLVEYPPPPTVYPRGSYISGFSVFDLVQDAPAGVWDYCGEYPGFTEWVRNPVGVLLSRDIVSHTLRTIRPWYTAANMRMTRLYLALWLYYHDHGELPARLDALVPDYIESIPECPFSGEAFVYELDSETPSLRGVGLDRELGTRTERESGERDDDDHMVFLEFVVGGVETSE